MSAVVQAGLRPLRLFAVVLALGCAGFAVAAVVTGAAAARAQAVVVGEAPAGRPVTLTADRATGRLVVLASRPGDVSADASDRCTLSGAGHAAKVTSTAGGSPTLRRDGELLRPLAAVAAGWRDGEQLTCSGPHLTRIAVVSDPRRGLLLRAALFAAVAVGAGLLATAGWRARRRRAGA